MGGDKIIPENLLTVQEKSGKNLTPNEVPG